MPSTSTSPGQGFTSLLISREVKPWPGDVDVEGMPEDSIVVEEKGS